jgi:hypothetical protein
MQYRVCPQCRNWNSKQTVFCLFCGKPLLRRAARVSRETAHSPRVRSTFTRRAQVALILLALCISVVAPFFPDIAHASEALGAQFLRHTIVQAPIAAGFAQSSGTYNVKIYLSQAVSDDPATKSAADDILGKRYDGAITISVDPGGSGSIQVNQAFFTPNAISVAAFTNESGTVSANTLYGTIHQSGMKVSIVCVFENGEISGFIWLDSEQSHIEFLYYS